MLKFKKMEVYGFKSFADKLEIKFESGVTGIVGPNGCGKSNVADAIRWVLGEQSAKALRGSSMQDVIFNGTENRKSQSFCEVSLYFDNTYKIFPIEYDEVVLSRKLYRSGESEYAINKTPCRLKDIVDLLRDSGLGKESYSIIGQGRIDELLSAKPEDRRSVFEEAAGISKFKSRKVDAERKLARTHDNLTRINDIIYELERQLGPLAKQSENAKKYLELKERLKHLEVNTYIYQYDTASTSKEEIRTRMNALSEELALRQKDFDEAIALYEKSVQDVRDVDSQIEVLRDELLSLTVGIEKQAGEVKLVAEKIDNLTAMNTKLQEDISQDTTTRENQKLALQEKKHKIELLEDIIAGIQHNLEKSNAQYLDIVDKLTQSEEAFETSGNLMLETLDKLTLVKVDLTTLNSEKNAKLQKIEENSLSKQQVLQKIDEVAKQKNTTQQTISQLNEVMLNLKTQLDKKEREEDISSKQLQELIRKDELVKTEFHRAESRLRLLEEMKATDEGFTQSVRKLLQDAKTNASLSGNILGVVAQLIKVPKQYEVAIEMALGASVQNIVTKNEDNAKVLVEYLKNKQYGRATFLPISSMKPRALTKEQEAYLKEAGVLGVANQLVQYPSNVQSVVASLLGSTVIVDTMDHAISLARKSKYSFKIVTLEGDILNPQGSLTGGSAKQTTSSLISRDREISELKRNIPLLNEQIAENTQRKQTLQAQGATLQKEIFALKDEIHAQEVAYTKANDTYERYSSEYNALVLQQKDIDKRMHSLKAEVEKLDDAIQTINSKEQQLSSAKDTASEAKKETVDVRAELNKKREFYLQEVTELKVKLAANETELKTLKTDIVALNEDISALQVKIQTNKVLLQQNMTNMSALENALHQAMNVSKQQKGQDALREVRDKLANLDTYKQSLQNKMNEADANKMTLSSEIQRITERKNREEMHLAKIDIDIETMQERVFEEYGLTYSTALKLKEENYNNEEGLQESGKIRKQIQALGYVNVNAIEELQSVSERYNDLAKQRDDLQTAEDDLNKIIKELTQQMEQKFKQRFEEINANFQVVFKELFGGGNAKLILHEDEGLLEAGIDIVAEPPGKKLQNITLLSGGERALTAIAILFSILKLKPMPFCVLDEIEAALDDANVERFARYLQRFSENTQFIVITHRKPTMELANSLYGVTMEEKGVSKVVSVKLSDAVKNAEVK